MTNSEILFTIVISSLSLSVLMLLFSVRDLRNRLAFREDQFERLKEVTEGIVKYLKEHT